MLISTRFFELLAARGRPLEESRQYRRDYGRFWMDTPHVAIGCIGDIWVSNRARRKPHQRAVHLWRAIIFGFRDGSRTCRVTSVFLGAIVACRRPWMCFWATLRFIRTSPPSPPEIHLISLNTTGCSPRERLHRGSAERLAILIDQSSTVEARILRCEDDKETLSVTGAARPWPHMVNSIEHATAARARETDLSHPCGAVK